MLRSGLLILCSMMKLCGGKKLSMENVLYWQCQVEPLVKVNVDGSFRNNCMGIGGVVRDHEG